MSRRSSFLLALVLLCSGGALARGRAAPKVDDASDVVEDLQLIGWSQDEQRFALRVYDLADLDGDDLSEPPPYCPGYVDLRGKKFRGSVMLQAHDGKQFTGAWNIQDVQPCTAPETARERLAQAKANLEQQGIDLSAVGSTVAPPRKGGRSSPPKSKPGITTTTTRLALPSGPWARQFVEISCRVETRQKPKPKGSPTGWMSSKATFTVRLRSGKKPTSLGEFTLGPDDWMVTPAGHWIPTVHRLFLSPSGKSFVLVARLDSGSLRDGGSSSMVLGRVDLPESSSPVSARAR
jgi:hypothetical protein